MDDGDFDIPPTGGRVKLILLGIVLPGLIAWYATDAWMAEKAYWPARQGRGIRIYGEAARALAVVYLSVAGFCHTRWFWGILQWERTFRAGTIASCLFFLGALLWVVTCV